MNLCSLNLQEIQNKAVSDFNVHLSKRFKKKNETQAGLTYPELIPPSTNPACNITPLAQSGQSVRTKQANQECLKIQENLKMSMLCSEVAGSNPSRGFPAAKHSSLSDTGAGKIFYDTTIIPSCAHDNYQYSGCGSAIAVSVPLHHNLSDHPGLPPKPKTEGRKGTIPGRMQKHRYTRNRADTKTPYTLKATVPMFDAKNKVYSCAAKSCLDTTGWYEVI